MQAAKGLMSRGNCTRQESNLLTLGSEVQPKTAFLRLQKTQLRAHRDTRNTLSNKGTCVATQRFRRCREKCAKGHLHSSVDLEEGHPFQLVRWHHPA